jgi:putative tricarboxylic transport membrane protein
MSTKMRDKIGGAVFALFGLIITLFTGQIQVPANLSEPGPRLFPYIAGVGMIICGIGMMLTAKQSENDKPFLTKEGWKRLLIVGAVLFAYYLGLVFLGFLISTPFFTFAIIMILSSGTKLSKIGTVVIALITTAALYIIFNNVFKILLPNGIFF